MTTFDYGPIEFYAIGFDGDKPGPGILQAVDDLVATGTINVLDLVFATRSPEGELTVMELSDTTDDGGVPAGALGGGTRWLVTTAHGVAPRSGGLCRNRLLTP